MNINSLAQTPVPSASRPGVSAAQTSGTQADSPERNELERVRVGVVLVDRETRVLSANRVARRMLQGQDGLTVRAGRLVSLSMRETALLQQCIAAMQDPLAQVAQVAPMRAMRVSRPRSKTQLDVIVAAPPDPIDPSAGNPAAMIYIIDPILSSDQGIPSFIKQYGLTASEARVATITANGNSGRTAARLLGVSYNTIKTHLKRIYSKTGVEGRGGLIRLLLVTPESD